MSTAQHRTPETSTPATSAEQADAPARALANPRRNRLAHVTSIDELRAAARIDD